MFEFVIGWIILIIAISVHEFAHAWAADKKGDPTPRLAGRLTLDPRAHIDPVGTVLLPLMLFLSNAPFFIGWAKPTPVDTFNLRQPKKDHGLIAFAGPLSNLLLATITSLIIRFSPLATFSPFLTGILVIFVSINVILAIFNLIPIHPLDGFSVVAGLMPDKYYRDWLELSKYGIVFLFLLIIPFFGTSPLSTFLSPIVNFILSILLPERIGGLI
jgi:Zn-dependent protease